MFIIFLFIEQHAPYLADSLFWLTYGFTKNRIPKIASACFSLFNREYAKYHPYFYKFSLCMSCCHKFIKLSHMSGSLQPTNESRNAMRGTFWCFYRFLMIFASLCIQFTAPGMWGVGSNPVCCWLHILLYPFFSSCGWVLSPDTGRHASHQGSQSHRGASLKVKQTAWLRRLITGIMYDLYVL